MVQIIIQIFLYLINVLTRIHEMNLTIYVELEMQTDKTHVTEFIILKFNDLNRLLFNILSGMHLVNLLVLIKCYLSNFNLNLRKLY